jgi:hypothetical protein
MRLLQLEHVLFVLLVVRGQFYLIAVYLSFELKFCASVGYFVLAKYFAAKCKLT